MEWLSCLDRKLVRDVIRLRSQVLAIALVIACGVAMRSWWEARSFARLAMAMRVAHPIGRPRWCGEFWAGESPQNDGGIGTSGALASCNKKQPMPPFRVWEFRPNSWRPRPPRQSCLSKTS